MAGTAIKQKRKSISFERYAGKWVAFVNEKIVAWDDTLEELDKEIQKKALSKKASYFLVPRKDEGHFILKS